MAKNNLETWSDCLWTSGGHLNVDKCFCYIFQPTLNHKTWNIKYVKLKLPYDLTIYNHKKGTNQKLLKLSPHTARRALGVFLSPYGNGSTQLQQTLLKAKEFQGKFRNATMSNRAKGVAIHAVIEPALLYPLANTFFKCGELKPIESIISQMRCAALGLNRNFPQALLWHHTTWRAGSPSPTQKITRERTNYFLMNIRRDSILEKKFSASIIYTQMEIGSFEQFFSLPFSQYSDLTTITMGIQIWSETEPFCLVL